MAGSKAKRRPRRTADRTPSEHAPVKPAKEAAIDATRAASSDIATPPPAQARFRTTLVIVAFAYLVTVWFEGIGSSLPAKLSPRVWLYFSQVAALFKNAGMMSIDYRAEGWSCADRRWIEVDVRPWFRIESDTKESRFHRALQFYRKERKVMRALEDFVIQRHNASSGREKIGGVRFLSLRIPYPKIGDRVERLERKPLSAYPEDIRHAWYWTPTSRRRERCGERPAPDGRPAETAKDEEAQDESREGPREGPRKEGNAPREEREPDP